MKKKKKHKDLTSQNLVYNSPFLHEFKKTLIMDESITPDEFTNYITFGYIFAYQYIPITDLKLIIHELITAEKFINKYM